MKKYIYFLPILLWSNLLYAQQKDTIVTFADAKSRLMNLNLSLLAAYYDVDIARAGVIQAKVWNNPYFVFNGDLYSNETNEYFHFRNQHLLQLEQTFSIAGKHTNTVKLAKIGVEVAEKQLEDVLRSLLFEMGNTYGNLSALQEKQFLYQQVISNYDKLMAATRKQLEVGSISLTEALRLESEYVAVKTEALQNFNEKERVLSELRMLLRYPADTSFIVEQKLPLIAEEFDLQVLTDQALSSRPDVLIKKLEQDYQDRNLRLQKSIAVPDLKLAYQPRDRGSNYVRPYQGFNVEFSVPLFDRNQGDIKAAEFGVKKANLNTMQIEIQIKNEVSAAYNRYKSSNTGLANYKLEFINQLKELNKSTNENFQKRNISLLEFIDQQRIFVLTNIQLIELRQQFLNNVNELNFVVGTNLIEY
ncbi:MAG: TolC family protein [Cytophagia bacterium]|nr:TolC family protein [Cytophagia bacterium]NBW37062.1 TolC family protein [Cytophagia bacterium]